MHRLLCVWLSLIITLFESSRGQFLNQPCMANVDCTPQNSYCLRNKASPTGTCSCKKGFSPDGSTPDCVKSTADAASSSSSTNFVVTVIGNRCSSNSDCSDDPNAICQSSPNVCSPRVNFCACAPNFVVSQGRCKKNAVLGDACDSATACTGARTMCNPSSMTCTCDSSSKQHPKAPGRCVAAHSNAGFGQSCQDDSDCFDEMECDGSQCSCKVGYIYDPIQQKCRPNALGDDCSDNSDCFLNKYAQCSNGICDCTSSYKQTVVSLNRTVASVCLPAQTSSRQLGDSCDDDGFNYCRPPLVCTDCTGDGSNRVCANPAVPGGSIASTPKPPPVVSKPKLIGDHCDYDSDCSGITNAICNNDYATCACRDGYEQLSDQQCVLKAKPTTQPTKRPARLHDSCDSYLDCVGLAFVACDFDAAQCSCIPGYSENDQGNCVPPGQVRTTTTTTTTGPLRLHDHCDWNSDCSGIPNTVCSSNMCTCQDGFREDEYGSCVRRATTTVRPAAIHDPCSSYMDCQGIPFATCDVDDTATCICLKGYRESDNGCVLKAATTTTQRQAAIHDPCSSYYDCQSIPFSTCDVDDSLTCICAKGYKESDYGCVPKPTTTTAKTTTTQRQAAIHDPCSSYYDCQGISFATCDMDDTSTCICLKGYRESDYGCVPMPTTTTAKTTTTQRQAAIHDPCSSYYDCQGISFATCDVDDTSTCICLKGYRESDYGCVPMPTTTTAKTTTTQRQATIHDPCSSFYDCQSIPFGTCDVDDTSTCICQRGYVESGYGTCVPKPIVTSTTTVAHMRAGLHDPCYHDEDCQKIAFSACDFDGTSTCECQTGYTENNYGNCVLKQVPPPVIKPQAQLHDHCDSYYDCLGIPNAMCNSDSSTCSCFYGYVENQWGTCVDISTTTKAPTTTTTTPSFNLLHDHCDFNSDCSGIPNAICDFDTNTCRCPKDFDETIEGDACTATRKKPTTTTTTTTTTKRTTTTTRKTTTTKATTTKVPSAVLGGHCFDIHECESVKYAYCTKDHKCACSNGYHAVGNKKCTKSVISIATTESPMHLGDSCTHDYDCSEISNAICGDYGECACSSGFADYGEGGCSEEGHTAAPKPACVDHLCPLGAQCNAGIDKCKTLGAACYKDVCQCPESYKPGPKNDCISNHKTARAGQSCDSNSQCYYNLICSKYTCSCATGMKLIGDYECANRTIGDQCSFDRDCAFVKNGLCIHGICQCDSGYTRISATQCSEAIWVHEVNTPLETNVPCTADNDCFGPGVPMNAVCGPNRLCQCPANSILDRDRRCKFLVATDLTGWSCEKNSDCGEQKNNLVCVQNQCQKQQASIISRAAAIHQHYYYYYSDKVILKLIFLDPSTFLSILVLSFLLA